MTSIHLLFFLLALPSAFAFTFTLNSAPTQCGNFTASWAATEDGHPPYELLLVPVGHVTPEIRTIVDVTSNDGLASFTLKFPTGSQFVAVLSSAAGVGSGGTSDVLTVGDGPADCLTGPVAPKFFLFIDNTPSQCAPAPISWSNSANGISLWGIIPGGNTFSLNPPSSGTSFNWLPNVRAGTQMLIVAGDNSGRGTGGSTDIFTVGGGSDSCISANSPSTTNGPAAGQVAAVTSGSASSTSTAAGSSGSSNVSGATSTTDGGSSGAGASTGLGSHATSGASSGSTAASGNGNANGSITTGQDNANSHSDVGKIVGIVVGVLGALLLGFLGLFCLVRRRTRRMPSARSSESFTGMRNAGGDLLGSRPPSIATIHTEGPSITTRAPHENVPRIYETEPFMYPSELQRHGSGYSADVSETHEGYQYQDDSMDEHLLGAELHTPSSENPFEYAAALRAPRIAVPRPAKSPAPTYATRGSDEGENTRLRVPRARLFQLHGPSTGSVDVPPSYDSWNPNRGPLVAVNATGDDKSARTYATDGHSAQS